MLYFLNISLFSIVLFHTCTHMCICVSSFLHSQSLFQPICLFYLFYSHSFKSCFLLMLTACLYMTETLKNQLGALYLIMGILDSIFQCRVTCLNQFSRGKLSFYIYSFLFFGNKILRISISSLFQGIILGAIILREEYVNVQSVHMSLYSKLYQFNYTKCTSVQNPSNSSFLKSKISVFFWTQEGGTSCLWKQRWGFLVLIFQSTLLFSSLPQVPDVSNY